MRSTLGCLLGQEQISRSVTYHTDSLLSALLPQPGKNPTMASVGQMLFPKLQNFEFATCRKFRAPGDRHRSRS